jgi:hypothetical protein
MQYELQKPLPSALFRQHIFPINGKVIFRFFLQFLVIITRHHGSAALHANPCHVRWIGVDLPFFCTLQYLPITSQISIIVGLCPILH